MTRGRSHNQSGEPKGQVKKEGIKNFSHDDEMPTNIRDLRGGDNATMSKEEWDKYEKQQAGGTHKGGMVPGAYGDETKGSNTDKGM